MSALVSIRPPAAPARPDRLERAVMKKVGEAISEHGLIADGDRIMVCVSGGKDSWVLLDVLRDLQRRAPVGFDILAVNVDQGWAGYDTARIEAHLVALDVPYRMEKASYAEVVEAKRAPDQTPCVLCSRFRRGYLYDLAQRLGMTKIALGHHADDLIETLLLNLFFSGRLAAMPPRLVSDDGRNVVIRPLAFVSEAETTAWAAARGAPLVRCGCPSCGLPDQQRQVVKRLVASLEAAHPGTRRQMLAALKNVRASHLLDRGLLERLAAAGARFESPQDA